ncbi:MAG: hypothetical protein A2Z08_07425 [Deltaproteobacteria bacterium RBG_16_54_11]|nr:MAG: hypothetical protein A2Z08_07425 [Deltaproteobacteria bacterium RBG_16_54_11]
MTLEGNYESIRGENGESMKDLSPFNSPSPLAERGKWWSGIYHQPYLLHRGRGEIRKGVMRKGKDLE